MGFSSIPPDVIAAYIIVLFFGIGIHEYAHCKVADMCGDPTPRYYGRVTLNLFKHFDAMGVIMMVMCAFFGIGIGGGKPAPCDDSKMGNPRWDGFATVFAGPMSNLAQAAIYALVFRLVGTQNGLPEFANTVILVGILANLTMMLFNLIPFGPLDGHWLVGYLLPEKQRYHWFKVNRSIGMFGLMIVVTIFNQIAMNGGPDVIGLIIHRPTMYLFRLLTGVAIEL